jgi:hypothetical protein
MPQRSITKYRALNGILDAMRNLDTAVSKVDVSVSKR